MEGEYQGISQLDRTSCDTHTWRGVRGAAQRTDHFIREQCCCWNALYISASRVLSNHRRFESRIGADRGEGGSGRASRIKAHDVTKQDPPTGDFESELLLAGSAEVSWSALASRQLTEATLRGWQRAS